VSKNDPARADAANKPPPERTDAERRAAADPAVDESLDVDEEALRETDRPDRPDMAAPEGDREIDRLHADLEEAKDRALRSQAELENYRKRVARQMEEERRYANVSLIRDLLPVWDNMGRAIEAAEKTHETASLLEGFKMVAAQLETVLERHHCVKIDALEKPFDPNLHDAICQQPSDEHPVNTVLQVTQTGFRLHDRVIRPSQVIVSTAVPQTAKPPEGDQARQPDKPDA